MYNALSVTCTQSNPILVFYYHGRQESQNFRAIIIERIEHAFVNRSRLEQQLNPIPGLVAFFLRDVQFVNEISHAFGVLRFCYICSN